MSIRTLRDTGAQYTIPAYVDGAVYQLITDDCVIGGLGDEFTVNYSASSFAVSFIKGSLAVLSGNFFWVTGDESVVLPANSVVYLCARIDTSKQNGQTGSFEILTSASMKGQNLNSGGVKDLLLYVITTGGSGVTNVEDKRYIRHVGLGNITCGTLNQGNTSITIKDSRIRLNSALSFYTSIYGVQPNSVNVNDGSVTLEFDAQKSAMQVGIRVDGVMN